MRCLEPEDSKIFFDNWLRLLAFVNDKYNLVKDFGHPESPVDIKPEIIIKIKTKLWEDVNLIDEYIDSSPKLSKNNTQIIKNWKNNISGHFLIIRQLKKHSVFMHNEKTLYGVLGISNPISDIFPKETLPSMVQTVLLPFKGVIIYDSIFLHNRVTFGPNMRRSFNETYSELKREKGIVTEFTIL